MSSNQATPTETTVSNTADSSNVTENNNNQDRRSNANNSRNKGHKSQSGNRNNRNNKGGQKYFKGSTLGMNGNVFQLYAERNNKSQFHNSMESMWVYASTAYRRDIEKLTVMLTHLQEPKMVEINKPEESEETEKRVWQQWDHQSSPQQYITNKLSNRSLIIKFWRYSSGPSTTWCGGIVRNWRKPNLPLQRTSWTWK